MTMSDGGKRKTPHQTGSGMDRELTDGGDDPTEGYEPLEVNRTGEKGLSKEMVVDIIRRIAGEDPFEDGTRPRKIHSAKVKVHLAPEVEVETVARIVSAFERLNLLVYAKQDGRFKDGVNVRALTVARKLYTEDHYPDTSPWWDSAGVNSEVFSDE